MKHLPLVFCFDCPVLEALDISRTIQKIVLHVFSPEDPTDMLAVLARQGQEVRELVIRRFHLAADVFCGILQSLPQLRKISLEDISFNHYDEIIQRVATSHLTHVVISECHPAVSEFNS